MSDDMLKIFVLKASENAGTFRDEKKLDALQLRHPRTGQTATFLLDVQSMEVLEVQLFDGSPRSWFIGSRVESDGQIHVCTPFDPLFMVLSYMKQSGNAQQLDQLLVDHRFPDLARLVPAVSPARLSLIADRKGDPELLAYKYNEQRAMTWLEQRTRRLAAVLETKRLHGTSGKADNFVKVDHEDVDKGAYIKYAWGITSEYLSDELSAALRHQLQLPEEKTKRSAPGVEPPAKRSRGGQTTAPLEDYSQPTAQNKKIPAPQNAKQKALAKSAIGTKSIASFFKKK